MILFIADEAGVPPDSVVDRLEQGCKTTTEAYKLVMSWERTGIRFENPLTTRLTTADKERMWGQPKPGAKKPKDKTKTAGKVLYQGRISY